MSQPVVTTATRQIVDTGFLTFEDCGKVTDGQKFVSVVRVALRSVWGVFMHHAPSRVPHSSSAGVRWLRHAVQSRRLPSWSSLISD